MRVVVAEAVVVVVAAAAAVVADRSYRLRSTNMTPPE